MPVSKAFLGENVHTELLSSMTPRQQPQILLTTTRCLAQCNSSPGFLSVIFLDILYQPSVSVIELKNQLSQQTNKEF